MDTLPRSWFERDSPELAPLLLNKLLVVSSTTGPPVSGRITEVEAYRSDDPASHSFSGPTERNRLMFGPAGHLYVYLSYGIHHCANVVTGRDGDGQAVLLRALDPVSGVEKIRERRGHRPDRELADGPGKLCQALGIDLSDRGADLTDAQSSIRILDDGVAPPSAPVVGPRVGITKAVEVPWRFRVPRQR